MIVKTVPLSFLAIFASFFFSSAQNEYPTFVELGDKPPQASAQQIFRELFEMNDHDALELVDTFEDDLGFTHQTFQQYYKGVKVDGATYRLHIKGGRIWYMSGHFFDIYSDLSERPAQTPEASFGQVLDHVGANQYIWEDYGTAPEPELVILANRRAGQAPRLAYKFDIYARQPLYRAFVYIDANSGEYAGENLRIHHAEVSATGLSLYNGSVSFKADDYGPAYRLRQSRVQTFDMNNGTNHGAASDVVSSSTHFSSDPAAVQAHWGAEKTYQYFLQRHGRNSFDGAGSIIRSYVHYGTNYNNAFWDGLRMTYGDGDGVNFSPLVSIDVVGHEIAHGVTDYSADLVYGYESGALNESFSDIFGEAIERYAAGANDWLMGADIKISGAAAIRSMSNPKAYGDPDTYKGTYWYSGSGDNGGVHTNSGVQNKWFYILSEGESGVNDLGHSYNVAGIGIDKAAAIAYRNLTVYLSAYSNYADARAGAVQAAEDLYGAGSAEVAATAGAWYAVGVGEPVGQSAYCASGGANAGYEWIAKVSVGAFSSASGAAGYTDFTSKTIAVNAGQSYALRLEPGFAATSYNEYWKIWIDYNADGDFTDAGEMAFDAGAPSNSAVSGTMVIPPGANGDTRMRVSMKYNAGPSPCEHFNYGEVEDYGLSIGSDNNGDTQPPSAPGNLTASNTTQTSTYLSWSVSSDNVGVAGYYVYVDGSLAGTTSNRNFTLSGLSPGTVYTVSVTAKDAAGNESAPRTITVTTPGDDGADNYCAAQGNNAASEWIAGVSIGAFSNASGSAGYSDFTSKTIGVNAGQTYNIVLTPAFSGTAYNEYWRIWIDYNRDGDFTDGGELVFDSGSAGKTAVTGLIQIPAGAQGETRLRIAMRYNTAPATCGSFNYGEVEDYTVSIGGGDEGDTTPPSAPGGLTAYNTTQTSTGLSWSAASDNVGVVGYDIYVDGVFRGTTTATSFTVNGLAPGLTYVLSVVAKDAAGNESAAGSIQITTQSEDPGVVYCAAQGNNAASEWIAGVAIGAFSHASGAAGYSDFTSKTISVSAGQSYDLVLTPAFSGTIYSEYWRIWIDYNRDGDFADSGELVFDPGAPAKNAVTGVVAIPAGAAGETRLRVAMRYNAAPSSCGPFNYGEVEDYTVSFGGGDGGGNAATLFAHYFETGWDGWSDGGDDCFRYSGPFSWEGDYSIQLRDDSGLSSAMTSAAYDLSGYTQLKIEFSLYAEGMESGEDLLLQYHDGSEWKTAAVFSSGTDFDNDQFHHFSLTWDHNEYEFPSDARFRFLCDASSNQDLAYIDAVKATVYGPAAAVVADGDQAVETLPYGSDRIRREETPDLAGGREQAWEDLRLFPNPATEILHVEGPRDVRLMRLFSSSGVLIGEIPPGDETNRIDISGLQTGIYYLSVQTEGGVQTEKFVKK